MAHRFWQERLRIDGKQADGFIESRVVGASLIKRMEGAASLELACTDPDEAILKSGLLDRPGKPGRKAKLEDFETAAWARFAESRLQLDGIGYRLARVDGNYDATDSTITLTFEDEVAPIMRRVTSPVKLERTSGNAVRNRAGFIQMLALKAQTRGGFPFEIFIPNNSDEVEIKPPKIKQYEKGLDRKDKLTVKGRRATDEQLRHIETALTVADEEKAPDLAVVAMGCAGIGESSFIDQMNTAGSGYGGVFQGRVATPLSPNWFANMGPYERTREQAESFLLGGRGYQGGGAIALARQNPEWEPGKIALIVEGSRSNFGDERQAIGFYQQWHAEAEAILEAWGGVNTVHIIKEKFEFRAGGTRGGVEHNYWMDANDLAATVRWRLFAYHNILWFVPDEWLFQRYAQFILDQGRQTDGVHGIQFQADIGLPVSEFVVRAHAERWDGAPGGVVKVQDLGPFTGRWLLWEERQDCFTELADFTLRRPAPDLKEPAPTVKTKVRSERAPEKGTIRERIVAAAERALARSSKYTYLQSRPMPGTLFPKDKSIVLRIDCSAFATLCYKEAGADNPNGRGTYDGLGYTGTLAANGKQTTDPQPGDLCFYGPPTSTSSHVNLYLGNGMCANMGNSGLHKLPRDSVRSDFYYFRTYDLGDGS